MREKLQNTLNGKSRYSLEDGYEYGLKKYVEYFRKDNKRPAGQITHLVTMKDTKTPLRLLEAGRYFLQKNLFKGLATYRECGA